MEQPTPVEEPQEPDTGDDGGDAPQEGGEQGGSESVPAGDIESPAEPGSEAPTG